MTRKRAAFVVFLVMLFAGGVTHGYLGVGSEVSAKKAPPWRTITFPSEDDLEVTADLYLANSDKKTPFIVLFHQAGWSRGEYREIAPRLNKLGFNCLAVDQRAGRTVLKVPNETARLAAAAKKKRITFLDALPDMRAALRYARKEYAHGTLLAWGSSYSAALVLRLAGEDKPLADGFLAFAPGEYFEKFGKPKTWVQTAAKKISAPVFITSARREKKNWQAIYDAIPSKKKASFVPKTTGNHGSRALWKRHEDSDAYWKAVTSFLQQFLKK